LSCGGPYTRARTEPGRTRHLSSHARTSRSATSDTTKGSQANHGRQPEQRVSSPPVGTLPTAPDVADSPNQNSKPDRSSRGLVDRSARVRAWEQPATRQRGRRVEPLFPAQLSAQGPPPPRRLRVAHRQSDPVSRVAPSPAPDLCRGARSGRGEAATKFVRSRPTFSLAARHNQCRTDSACRTDFGGGKSVGPPWRARRSHFLAFARGSLFGTAGAARTGARLCRIAGLVRRRVGVFPGGLGTPWRPPHGRGALRFPQTCLPVVAIRVLRRPAGALVGG
jgi:hypothetical protein